MADIRETKRRPVPPRRRTSLEVANQMFKDAFIVKRTRFAAENPRLSERELDRLTAEYFAKLPSSPV